MTQAEIDAFVTQLDIMWQGGADKIHRVPLMYEKHAYILEDKLTADGGDVIVVIPKDVVDTRSVVKRLPRSFFYDLDFKKFGTIKVIGGGPELTSLNHLFADVTVDIIDLSEMHIDNVTSTACMFKNTAITKNTDFSWTYRCNNLTDTSAMFKQCSSPWLVLSQLNTKNVTNMEEMFSKCYMSLIGNMTTSNVTIMRSMFQGSIFDDNVDLSWIDFSNVENADSMFAYSKILKLNITGWNTKALKNTCAMFYKAKIKEINGIDGICFSGVRDANNMFAELYTESKVALNWDMTETYDMADMFTCCRFDTLDLRNVKCNYGNKNTRAMFDQTLIKKVVLSKDTMKKDEYGEIVNELIKSDLKEKVECI